jgi:hypothetical protein
MNYRVNGAKNFIKACLATVGRVRMALPWAVRVGAAYLAVWWALLYWSFSEAVEPGPVPARQYVVALLFGLLPHVPLVLATVGFRGVRRWLVGLSVLMIGMIYVYLVISKPLLSYGLGVAASMAAMGCLVVQIRRKCE